MPHTYPYHLFQAYGIEIEYSIVSTRTLLPLPIAHELLRDDSGRVQNRINLGDVSISNELAAHVIELKTSQPQQDLKAIAERFQKTVETLNARLAAFDACLAPGGMHPFMNPEMHGELWRYDDREIYEWYDKVFDCRTHGWFNLQSCHINLPFGNEEEFAILHDAIILALPLLPALAASSPYKEGEHEGTLDTRLFVYAVNQERFPEIAGHLVPERIATEEDYRKTILAPAYNRIKDLDSDGLIEPDWLNSRGAIARFDRGSIEIRIIDTQESPACDLALCAVIVSFLKKLAALDREELMRLALLRDPAERKKHFLDVARYGMDAPFGMPELSLALGLDLAKSQPSMRDFWRAILTQDVEGSNFAQAFLKGTVEQGPLAERMLRLYGPTPSREQLKDLTQALAHCLASGSRFKA